MERDIPHVFISYAWTSEDHKKLVKYVADRLISDGVNVTIDIYDLKDGDDKYMFMEKMVTDDTITKVLIMSDKKYKDRAEKREAGVGTETQIISGEVYERASKDLGENRVIPLVFERDEMGKEILPVYLSSRIYIDFSSETNINNNWEQLLRTIYNQPLFQKPQLGVKPSYLDKEMSTPSSPIDFKLTQLKNAISNDNKNKNSLRTEFLELCLKFVDEYRVKDTNINNIGENCVNIYNKLVVVRDLLVTWLDHEYNYDASIDLYEHIFDLLENLTKLEGKPESVSSWVDGVFDGHSIFLLDCIYYIIATLIKHNQFELIHKIIIDHYYIDTRYFGEPGYVRFSKFYYYPNSYIVNFLSRKNNHNYYNYSCLGILFLANNTNSIIKFKDIITADLLIFLVFLTNDIGNWYPQLSHHIGFSEKIDLFSRAEKKLVFKKIASATGIDDPEELRKKVALGMQRLSVQGWQGNSLGNLNKWFNLDNLGKL